MASTTAQPPAPLTTPERAATRRVHRGFFALLGLLPSALASSARARYFDSRFAAGTPWPYDACPYEAAKRAALVGEVPADARVVLEVGAADGHNLPHLADRAPAARVVGIDLSEQACDLARLRTVGRPEIVVERTDLPHAAARLPWLYGSVDALILAEVLYYFGGPRATAEQLAPVGRLLSAAGRVVLVHGSADAHRLHTRAAGCLGLTVTRESHHAADGRDFLVTVLMN